MHLRILPGLFALLAVVSVSAHAQTTRTVQVGGLRVNVAVPTGYSFQLERAENGVAVKMENPVWGISILAEVASYEDPGAFDPQWQRDLFISRYADALAQSRETDYNFKPLGPRVGTGLYCVFTDAKYKTVAELPPNEFLHMTAGVRVCAGYVVLFSIMSNDVLSPEYREAFAVFRESFD